VQVVMVVVATTVLAEVEVIGATEALEEVWAAAEVVSTAAEEVDSTAAEVVVAAAAAVEEEDSTAAEVVAGVIGWVTIVTPAERQSS